MLFGAFLLVTAYLALDSGTDRLAQQIEERTGGQVLIAGPQDQSFDPRIAGTHPNALQAFIALRALNRALDAYPAGLLEEAALDILLAGRLTLLDYRVGGTVQPHGWVLLATDYLLISAGPDYLQRAFHHEYSSLLILLEPFPNDDWLAHLPDGFAFPETDDERLALTQVFAEDLSAFHDRGFVSDYGASSLENDINTYAELLLHAPDALAELAEQHDLIRQKTILIRRFYETLDPDFTTRFNATALSEL